MGIIKLNPIEVINAKKVMSSSCDSIKSIVKSIQAQHNGLYPKVKSRVPGIDGSVLGNLGSFEGQVGYLVKIVHELVEATGFTEDQLLNGNYDENFYIKKIYAYLMNKYYDVEGHTLLSGSEYIAYFVSTDSNDETFKKYAEAKELMTKEMDFFSHFNFDRFDLDQYDVAFDLIYVRDHRGKSFMHDIMNTLLKCPDFYEMYNSYLSLNDQLNDFSSLRDFSFVGMLDPKRLDDFKGLIHVVNIHGQNFEIVQIVPNDCTIIELLAYNFIKGHTINTMKGLPEKFIVSKDPTLNNRIILSADPDVSYIKFDGSSGYYAPSKSFSETQRGTIFFDLKLLVHDVDFYNKYLLTHELSHRFDAFMGLNTDSQSDVWEELWNEYINYFDNFNGYSKEELIQTKSICNYAEFFADAMTAYLKQPEELKRLCPKLYELLDKLLNDSRDEAPSVVSLPEPEPGPGPESTPAPVE